MSNILTYDVCLQERAGCYSNWSSRVFRNDVLTSTFLSHVMDINGRQKMEDASDVE